MTFAKFGEDIKSFAFSKPLVSIPLGLGLLIGLAVMVSKGYKNYGNWFENADFLRQTMAPAFNETTGFLMISYAVILCIGNVIMKTSPKYLTGIDKATQEKTTGFVAWLQSRGLSWLPVLVSTTVITLMTFLPIDNKMFKIIIISVVLLATLIAALFFNTLIKIFGPKEKFTNVKEEFGHAIKDDEGKNQPHNLKITVQVRGKAGDGTTIDEFFVDIFNNLEDEHDPKGWRSEKTTAYDKIQLNYNDIYQPYIDLIYEPINNDSYTPIPGAKDYNPDSRKYDVYYSTVPASESNFISTLKILKPNTTTINATEISEQTYYFHLFPKDIKIFSGNPSKDKFKKGTEYTTNEDTGICTLGGKEILALNDVIWLHPPAYGKENNLSLSNHIRLKITETGTNNYGGFYSGSDHVKEKIKQQNYKVYISTLSVIYFEIMSIIDVERNKNIPEAKAIFLSNKASDFDILLLSI